MIFGEVQSNQQLTQKGQISPHRDCIVYNFPKRKQEAPPSPGEGLVVTTSNLEHLGCLQSRPILVLPALAYSPQRV